jgi:phosphate transport system protein
MTPDRHHTVAAFDTDLLALRSGVLAMAELAGRQFRHAILAIDRRDTGLAAAVLAGERELNALQVSLDSACSRVIMRHQPTAVDLREVIAALHSIGDLERIGDEAKKIAGKVTLLDGVEPDVMARIVAMAAATSSMVQRATDAYRYRDPTVANALGEIDDDIDDERDRLIADLTSRMAASPDPVPPIRAARLLELILIVQSIERVADHAEDFAEYVVNVTEGIDARHGNLPG